jgi:transcriptional regulator with XRE-family HTH domain
MFDLSIMDIRVKIGQRIKVLRKKIGISQESLAYQSEVDRTYVTDVENGRRNVSVVILEKLIKALTVSFAEFFDSKEFKK